MKLEQETLDILDNFVSINKSMQFKPGDVMTTCTPSRSILARAKISQKFDRKFAIYDLKKFLSVVSTLKDPELEFGDNQITFRKDKAKVMYTYADPESLVAPRADSIKLPSADVQFTLTDAVLKAAMSSVAVLNLPEIAITGDGSKLYLRAIDSEKPTADAYSVEIGETEKTFNIIIKVEYLKLIPGDYEVTVSVQNIMMAHFASEKIEYWVAVQQSSTVGK